MSDRYLLPCMRGAIGNWVTYTCLMSLEDISSLINYAEEVHSNKSLSKMIQRELRKDRQKEIAKYLTEDKEAFFSSLVVAVYQGEPKWHPFESISPNYKELESFEVKDYARECLGYLSITKQERMFALDGQHRLSGIRLALKENPEIGGQQIPVIFVGHQNTELGIKRTRRLFTTLNKKAKPVNKSAIIALDEDDVCAVITRYVVEENYVLSGSLVKFQSNNNISYSPADQDKWTTIGNIYDLCKLILTKGLGYKNSSLVNFKQGDEVSGQLCTLISDIFSELFEKIEALKELKDASCESNNEKIKSVVNSYRNKEYGGHFLFRPAGIKCFLSAMSIYASKNNEDVNDFYEKAVNYIEGMEYFDFSIDKEPFLDRFWSEEDKKVVNMKAQERDYIVSFLVDRVV